MSRVSVHHDNPLAHDAPEPAPTNECVDQDMIDAVIAAGTRWRVPLPRAVVISGEGKAFWRRHRHQVAWRARRR